MRNLKNKLLARSNEHRLVSAITTSLIGLGLMIGLATTSTSKPNKPTDITEMPVGWPYDSTVYKFRYGHRTRTVDDPNNKLQWIYGDLPDTILVSEGKRLIIYDSPGAVLHSENDSVSVQYDSVKYGGYMGIWSEGTTFIVGLEGIVMEYQWHPYPGCYIC